MNKNHDPRNGQFATGSSGGRSKIRPFSARERRANAAALAADPTYGGMPPASTVNKIGPIGTAKVHKPKAPRLSRMDKYHNMMFDKRNRRHV
jgi:hypothetical protein